jgi:REP element-mobilizing transposase RayT
MLYLELESENWGFPIRHKAWRTRQYVWREGQIRRKAETQSQWVLMQSQDSQVAEETKRNKDPKDLPLGFLFTPLEITPMLRNGARFLTGFTNEQKKMRQPRIYLEGAVYYTTVRASAGELLFREDEDCEYFLDILKERKKKYNFKLYAFCLLPHHYHLLIETKDKNISKIMQAINTSYSLYFNNKYKREGHLIAGRFEMKLVNKDISLLEVSYHLHLNPIRLGLVKAPEDYRFSSYLEYTKDADFSLLVDYGEIASLVGPLADKQAWRIKYRELIQEFAQENPTSLTKHQEVRYSAPKEITSERRLRPGLLVGLSSGLLIILILFFLGLHLVGLKPTADKFRAARELNMQKNALSLPEGLPAVETIPIEKKQVWELWKM